MEILHKNYIVKTFAKIIFASLLIFAVIFCVWFNFAPKNQNTAKAVGENNQNYTVKKLDFINFDGKSYIKTGVDQLGDIGAKVDFALSIKSTMEIFGSRADGGWQDSSFYLYYLEAGASSISDIVFVYGGSVKNLAILNQIETDRYILVQNNNVSEFYINGESATSFSSSGSTPTNASEIYLGAMRTGSLGVNRPLVGKIYSFQIFKGRCDDANFANQADCENAGETWSRELVLNFVPAVRYFGCGDNFSVEYGFVNDLDNDGNLANDEFFANSGTGTLAGSEEIVAEKCAEILPENPENYDDSNDNSEIPPATKPNNNFPLAPNTGFAK